MTDIAANLIRRCTVCDVDISHRHRSSLTCSNAHSNVRRKERIAKWKRDARRKSCSDRACLVCGIDISHRRPDARYCSNRCSDAKEVERNRERRQQKKQPPVVFCVQCKERFEAYYRTAKYCSPKCEYAFNAEVKRERCRSWRVRNPDKQRASSKRWEENNREKSLEYHADKSRRFRKKYRDRVTKLRNETFDDNDYLMSITTPQDMAGKRRND